jgi:ribosomal protein S18 acetylase RimI-like enzyme
MAMKLVEQHRDYDPVRFARLADIEGMAWFYGGQTETDGAAVLVADEDGGIVGFGYVAYEVKNYADLSVSAARLHDIYVDDAVRHKGVGKLLLDAAITVAKQMGASKMMLSVAAQNTLAEKFFWQAGFRTTMHEMMLVLAEPNKI